MKINVEALYYALARVLEQREQVKIKITVKELGNEKDSRD